MTSAAILARLNPANVRFDIGSGGIPDLTQTDIASALSGQPPLPELAIKLALVKYAGQQQELGRLFYWTRDAAVRLCIKHQWGKPKKGQLGGISMYAIWEMVDPHYCVGCGGSGKRLDDRRRSWNCMICNGTGRALIPDEHRADIAGFDPDEWQNTWRARGDLLAGHLDMMDRWVCGRIRRRLIDNG